MGKKRRAFVHVGLDDSSGDVVELALDRHTDALLELRVKHPAKSREEMLRATVEVLGLAEAWGFSDDEVAGTWEQVCRRAAKGRDTVVISQPMLAGATPAQAAHVVAGLADLEVHVVVTVGAPDAWTSSERASHDLAGVLERWQSAVHHPERIHVVVTGSATTATPADTWRAFGRLAGFGTASLRVEGLPLRPRVPTPAGALHADVLNKLGTGWAELLVASRHDVVGDPDDLVPAADAPQLYDAVATERALLDARQDIERLIRHNEALELRLASTEKKRAKLKRRLSERVEA